MKIRNIDIHLKDSVLPEIHITEYSDFCSIVFGDSAEQITFYLKNTQQVIDFKDNVLNAFNKFMGWKDARE